MSSCSCYLTMCVIRVCHSDSQLTRVRRTTIRTTPRVLPNTTPADIISYAYASEQSTIWSLLTRGKWAKCQCAYTWKLERSCWLFAGYELEWPVADEEGESDEHDGGLLKAICNVMFVLLLMTKEAIKAKKRWQVKQDPLKIIASYSTIKYMYSPWWCVTASL